MDRQLQTIVLPYDDKHLSCRELFFHCDAGILDTVKKSLTLGFAQRCDFTTYFNAYSWRKWRTYTVAKNVRLELEIEGVAEIILIACTSNGEAYVEEVLGTKKVTQKTRGIVKLEYPENDADIVGFIITSLSDKLVIYGGEYTTTLSNADLNNVTLALATTTYKKEAFIKKNLNLLQTEVFSKDDDLSSSLYVHVVDNGQTLTRDEAWSKHITLHPSRNTGGSGGFSYGMILSLEQKPKATHVLLMDDDVLMLTESIRRTYNLLRVVRREYAGYVIAGAMLYFEEPWRQHEDVGVVTLNNEYFPNKPEYDLRLKKNVVQNEDICPRKPGSYSAWWYSCMPVGLIEKNGLSLPIFVRGDDAEYGTRSQANYITMNGICVWHMGFQQKTNIALKYFGVRNSLIMYAASNVISEQSALRLVQESFRIEILRFNYVFAALILDAFEDFLAGPENLMRIDNAEKMRYYSAQNPALENIGNFDLGHDKPKLDNPRINILERVYLKLTMNGQRLCPAKLHKSSAGYTSLNGDLLPKHIVACEEIVAYNTIGNNRTVFRKERKQYRKLQKRYKKDLGLYRSIRKKLKFAYQENRDKLVSIKNWKKYLGLK